MGYQIDSGVLNPRELWIYTGNYTITQEDIYDNGRGDGL